MFIESTRIPDEPATETFARMFEKPTACSGGFIQGLLNVSIAGFRFFGYAIYIPKKPGPEKPDD